MQLNSISENYLSKNLLLVFILVDLIVISLIGINYEYAAVGFVSILVFLFFVNFPEFTLALIVNGYFLIFIIGKPLEKHNELLILTKLLYLAGALYLWWRLRINVSFPKNPVCILAFLLGAFLVWGITYTASPEYGLWKTGYYFLNNLFILLSTAFLTNELSRMKKFYFYVVGFGIMLALLGLIMLYAGSVEGDRLRVFDVNPIWLSRAIGLSIIMSFFIFKTSSRMQQVIIAGILMLSAVAMVFSASRGPVIGLMLTAIVYYFIFVKKPLTFKLLSILIGLGVLYILFLAAPESMTSRFTEFGGRKDMSGLNRIEWFFRILPVLKKNFLFGIGTGGFSDLILRGDIRLYPHNTFAELFLENGIIAVITFILFLYYSTKYAFKLINNENIDLNIRYMVMAALMVLGFSLFNAMFSGDIAGNEQVWMAAGMIAGFYTQYYQNDKAFSPGFTVFQLRNPS